MTDPRELAAEALKADAGPLGHRFDYAPLARELLSALDALDAARKERLEAEKHAYQEGVGVGYEDGGIDGVLQGERQGNPLIAEAVAAGAKFQRIFRAIAEDASDGSYALFTDADLFNAEREFEAALAAVSAEGKP